MLYANVAWATTGYHRYTSIDGLPSPLIKHVNQLENGYIVISTDNGLAVFDGYEFYSHFVNTGLPDHFIHKTLVDHNGRLIVATDRGIAVADSFQIPLSFRTLDFNPVDNNLKIRSLFESGNGILYAAGQNHIYTIDSRDWISSVPFAFDPVHQSDFVRSFCLIEDASGGILITSAGNGLLYLPHESEQIHSLSDTGLPDRLFNIIKKDDRHFWISSDEGLFEIEWDPMQQQVLQTHLIPGSESLEVDAITPVNENELLIGTNGTGLHKWTSNDSKLRLFREFQSNIIRHIFIDRQKNQWISTDDGINIIPNMPFNNIGLEHEWSQRQVTGISADQENGLWISTHDGIYKRDNETGHMQKITYLDDEEVRSLRYSESENVIYAFGMHAIHEIDVRTHSGRMIKNFPSSMSISKVAVTSAPDFWLIDDSGILTRYNHQNEQTNVFGKDHGVSLPVLGITLSDEDRVWIGGESGFLANLSDTGEMFLPVEFKSDIYPDSILNITYLESGSDNNLIIGTTHGVFQYNHLAGRADLTPLLTQDINDIRWIRNLSDQIWIGTSRFLFAVTTDDQGRPDFNRRFSTVNGLVSTHFSYDAARVDHHDNLWMGTNIGIFNYNGGELQGRSSYIQLRYWTADDQRFYDTRERTLPPGTRQLSFAFSTLDFPADDVVYQVRLANANGSGSWSAPSPDPVTTRHFQGSGSYTFEVRASRQSSLWSEPLSIRFTILRPWWWQIHMIILYILLIFILVAGYIERRSRKLRQQNKELADGIRKRTEHLSLMVNKLEKEIKQRVNVEKQLQETNFTHKKLIKVVSHDLRSPFQGIMGYASMLRDQYHDFDDEERREMIGHIIGSSNKAVTLLNQLLEWTSFQSGKMPFNPVIHNLNESVSEVIGLLKSLAGSKNIHIKKLIPESMNVNADKQMLQSVLRNLLSNAIKFTNMNGEIIMKSKNYAKYIEISISDNGVGMDQKTLEQILEKNKSVSTRGTEKEAGSGLGLVMCKEMIELHGGKLTGKSQLDQGTTFTFTLPIEVSNKGRAPTQDQS
ncbi:MAG: ATP-binding protein [Balneolales bacterium]